MNDLLLAILLTICPSSTQCSMELSPPSIVILACGENFNEAPYRAELFLTKGHIKVLNLLKLLFVVAARVLYEYVSKM